MAKKSIMETMTEGIDEPIDVKVPFLKKGRLRCIIIFEDGSFVEYYKKLKDAYFIRIKKRSYLIVPKCIILGKVPTIIWFFNNPLPVYLKFERSKLKASSFYDEKVLKELTEEQRQLLSKVYMDSEGIDAAFDNKLLKGLYAEPGMFTMRRVILILVVVLIAVLVILQLTGTVDVMGFISGAKK